MDADQDESRVNNGIPTFEEAFGPLAHHLFPDGCPATSEGPDLSLVWPSRPDRTAVSSAQALSSIPALRLVAKHVGLSPHQLWAVTLVACDTLPRRNDNFVRVGSSLVDGTSKRFRALVRCLIPKPMEQGGENPIPSAVIVKLVSTRCDGLGKAVILRFLTLAIRSGCLVGSSRQTLSQLYGVIFPMVSDSEASLDAVRLLHALTRRRHVRIDRARRLKHWYDQSMHGQQHPSSDNTANNNNKKIRTPHNRLASIWLLLQLYARYDPRGCGEYFPSSPRRLGGSAWSRCFQINDTEWESDFAGSGRSLDETRVSTAVDTEMNLIQPTKRRRTMGETGVPPTSLSVTLDWLEDAFDGVHSFSWGLVDQQERRSLRASDLLTDKSLRQLILLSAQDSKDTSVSGTEVIRLRDCLPYMLHEEWYDQGIAPVDADEDNDDSSDDDSDIESKADDEGNNVSTVVETDSTISPQSMEQRPRVRVLHALASMAFHADSLLPEAEFFVLEEILPQWDGTDGMGLILCHDLLPRLSPCSFGDLNAGVLKHLVPLFTYGSPRVQYAVVSGALSSLVKRWGRLDWSESPFLRTRKRSPTLDTEEARNHLKHRTLQELILWTEQLILKRFLVDDGHELLRVACTDFYEAIADLSDCCPFLSSPSPEIVYRLFLSPSAVSVDRVCHLLVKYKTVFEKLKSQSLTDQEKSKCVNRISIFNCFVWDICSALWRCSPLPSLHSTGGDDNNLARSNSILFTDLPKETLRRLQEDASHVTSALSITHGAVFAGFASDFCKLQDVNGTMQLCNPGRILRGKLKVHYLDYLKGCCGLDGVYLFLTTFVGSLADREVRKQSKINTHSLSTEQPQGFKS